MDDQTLRKNLIRLAHSNPELQPLLLPVLAEHRVAVDRGIKHELKSKFPAEAHEKWSYRKSLEAYEKQLKKIDDPSLKKHKKLVDDALKAFMTLKVKIQDAERSLYH